MTKYNDPIYEFSIHKLNDHFQSLYKNDNSNKSRIEEEKLAVMQAFLTFLQPKRSIKYQKIKKKPIFKKIFTVVSVLINPLVAGAGGFSISTTLLTLIPGMLNPVTIVFGTLFGLVSGLLSAGVEAKHFKKNIGVSFLKLKPLLRTYQKQLIIMKKIQIALTSIECIYKYRAFDYIAFQKSVKLFNQDIQEKNEKLKSCYKKSSFRIAIKKTVSILNIILSAGAGFLVSKGLLTLLGAAFILSTPIGWAVGGALAIFSMASFYYLQRKNIYSLINMISGYPKKLMTKQNRFIQGINTFECKLRTIINLKRNEEIKNEQIKKRFLKIKPDSKRNKSNDAVYSVSEQGMFKLRYDRKNYPIFNTIYKKSHKMR